MWSAQIPFWARSFRLIVPDLPGHGSTPADRSLHRFDDYATSMLRLLDSQGIGNEPLGRVKFSSYTSGSLPTGARQ
jgi:pimeloyl-ACP methyl ester carboxylesterase